jgi:tRNA-binding protein
MDHDVKSLEEIGFDHFLAVDIKVGCITAAALNEKARKPAYVLDIDFGPLGSRRSSAQITENYAPEDLVGRQIMAVMNVPKKRIAGIKSEVLVLAAVCPEKGTVLMAPDQRVGLGVRIL